MSVAKGGSDKGDRTGPGRGAGGGAKATPGEAHSALEQARSSRNGLRKGGGRERVRAHLSGDPSLHLAAHVVGCPTGTVGALQDVHEKVHLLLHLLVVIANLSLRRKQGGDRWWTWAARRRIEVAHARMRVMAAIRRAAVASAATPRARMRRGRAGCVAALQPPREGSVRAPASCRAAS